MEELSKKTLPELRDMAKALNIKSVTKYKKNDLIELIKDNSNDNKEDNTAKDSDEHVKKQNIKAEQQKIEKENIDNNRNRYINRNNDSENTRQGEKTDYAPYVKTYNKESQNNSRNFNNNNKNTSMENRNQRNNKGNYVPKVVEESKIVNEFNTSKDDEVVEYAMSRTLSPMMVAEYKLQLPDKAVLQKKLQELINMPLIEE